MDLTLGVILLPLISHYVILWHCDILNVPLGCLGCEVTLPWMWHCVPMDKMLHRMWHYQCVLWIWHCYLGCGTIFPWMWHCYFGCNFVFLNMTMLPWTWHDVPLDVVICSIRSGDMFHWMWHVTLPWMWHYAQHCHLLPFQWRDHGSRSWECCRSLTFLHQPGRSGGCLPVTNMMLFKYCGVT